MNNGIQFELCGSDFFTYMFYPDLFTSICKYNTSITYGYQYITIKTTPCDLKLEQIWCPIKPVKTNNNIIYDQPTYFLYFPCK